MDQPAGVVRTGRRGEEEAGELGTDGSHGGVDVHAPMPGLLGRTRCVDVKVVEVGQEVFRRRLPQSRGVRVANTRSGGADR